MSHFRLESKDFKNNGIIPIKFTCDGDNVSPSLEWFNVPIGTQSFVLIVDDQDAKPNKLTHFVVVNIDSSTRKLKENQNISQIFPAMALLNGLYQTGWIGPCPPYGQPYHHYHFNLYAMKITPKLNTCILFTSEIFEKYYGQLIIDKALLVGKYKR